MGLEKWQLMPVMNRDLEFEKSRAIFIDTKSPLHHDPLVEIVPSAR